MDCCIVCLESNFQQFSRISIDSMEWNSKHIQRVVEKHFWWWYPKPQPADHKRSWICNHCWQKISSFHSFYLQIEMVHKEYETLLTSNMTKVKSKEGISKDIESQSLDNYKNVYANPKSSSDLGFNKKIQQKQVTNTESCGQQEEEKTILSACIKNEYIGDGYQTQVFEIKEEMHDNDSLSNDNVNCVSDNTEQTEKNRDKCTNEDEERGFAESPETRALLGKLKKNDIIDFNYEFQFKLECIICSSIETTFANLCSHYKDQHNMRGFAMCCGGKFFRRHLLIDHLCVHKDPNFFKCHRCNRVYRARDNLNFHLRKNKCTPKFECNVCGKQFLIQKNLMRHKLIHYRPTDDKYICKKCNGNFNTEALLKRHIQAGNCEIVCNDCGEIFLENCLLMCHLQNKCPAQKTNNSENSIASSEIVLGGADDITPRIKEEPSDNPQIYQDEHIIPNEKDCEENSENDNSSDYDSENNTSEVKAFKNMYAPSVSDDFFREMNYIMECCICDMILPDFQSLISHYRVVHNKIGYGMCCGKKYYRRGILADHLKLHKDPNLFKCHLCNRKLVTRRGLEKHMEVCAKKFERN